MVTLAVCFLSYRRKVMSEVSGTSAVSQLTIADVINPNKAFTASVLGEALKQKQSKASTALTGLAGVILDRAGCVAAGLAQEAADLKARIAANEKATSKLDEVVAYAQESNNVFALAAHVGLKDAAIKFAASNGLVVPANADPIWGLPKAE